MNNIIISGRRVATEAGLLPASLPEEMRGEQPLFRFEMNGEDCEVYMAGAEQEAREISPGLLWTDVRDSWQTLGEKTWRCVAKALELCNWYEEERFCRTCGTALTRHLEIAKRCPGCGAEWFAPMTPAVMVLVEDEEGKVLLVHAANFSRPFFGLVAGFVETGETLEETVVREVREETGLEIADVKYEESQSWPFPHQLMIGFTARKVGGELKFADGELTAGGFYSPEEYPLLAGMPSLARRLIERHRRKHEQHR